MASVCRLTVASGARYMVARSKTLPLRPVTSNPLISPFSSSSSTRAASSASRLASVLGTLESQKPLHTATATSRLKSIIAVDSSCWSWLSQEIANSRNMLEGRMSEEKSEAKPCCRRFI